MKMEMGMLGEMEDGMIMSAGWCRDRVTTMVRVDGWMNRW